MSAPGGILAIGVGILALALDWSTPVHSFADPFMVPVFGASWLGITLIGAYMTLIGYGIGMGVEQYHYFTLEKREKELEGISTSNLRQPPESASDSALVSANVALSADTLRYFSILFRRLVGGRIRRYERVNDRARREAIVRLKQATLAMGRNAIYNVRIQSSRITTSRRGKSAAVEILAYGTAMRVDAGEF